jgi:hypothetical protein
MNRHNPPKDNFDYFGITLAFLAFTACAYGLIAPEIKQGYNFSAVKSAFLKSR